MMSWNTPWNLVGGCSIRSPLYSSLRRAGDSHGNASSLKMRVKSSVPSDRFCCYWVAEVRVGVEGGAMVGAGHF